jgi:hypothetical protein
MGILYRKLQSKGELIENWRIESPLLEGRKGIFVRSFGI